MDLAKIASLIVDVPDYPKPGILFKDITPILGNASAFKSSIELLSLANQDFDAVAGIEARGFIFGSALAIMRNAPFLPVRKPGKLPRPTFSKTYDLEYGTDSLQIHQDAITPGARYLVVDDVLATGGTATATANLILENGGQLSGFAFLLAITPLAGMKRLANQFPTAKLTALIET